MAVNRYDTYYCPKCNNLSLMWDLRSHAFLCLTRPCGFGIGPRDHNFDVIVNSLTKNKTQKYLSTQRISWQDFLSDVDTGENDE